MKATYKLTTVDIQSVCDYLNLGEKPEEYLDFILKMYPHYEPKDKYNMWFEAVEDLLKTFPNSTVEKSDIKTQADRFNDGKLQWSLVDFKSLEPMVRVLEFGAKKYSAHQWKIGLPINEICESLLRHMFAYMNGENIDKDSGLPHLGHAQCNLMFLQYMMDNKPEFDNRTKPKQR